MATEYRLIRASIPLQFEEKVNEALTEGWRLHGTPFIDPSGCFVQAMIR